MKIKANMVLKYWKVMLLLGLGSTINLVAQRGYFDAPYLRYEANTGKLVNATITAKSFNQADLQSEASEQICVDMTASKASVEWKLTRQADGLVVRYSIPDSTSGELEVYANNKLVGTIKLTSHYSWEYLWNNGNPNNSGVVNTNPKMRFDEARLLLPAKVTAGGKIKLVNKSGKVHIDFIEMEDVPPAIAPAPGDIVYKKTELYEGDGSDLQNFIDEHGGKSLYIPAGVYTSPRELYFGVDNTTLKGEGMWHTQIHFKNRKWLKGGLYANAKDISYSDLYLTTACNARSDNYKAINGIYTSKSTIKNIWAEHFECGAWIAQYNQGEVQFAEGFIVSHCRFRNNYADGINLCKGTRNTVVEHCNFRNNGDDDMAIWCADNMECMNNTFQYCTSENCWRASGCAIYGGKNNRAHHLLIVDNLEAGLRVNNAFPGVGFNKEGMHEFSDITIVRCGTNNDLYYSPVGAIDLVCTYRNGVEVRNVKFSNIDILDSKNDAIYMSRFGGEKFTNFVFENITIDGTGKEYPTNNVRESDVPKGFGFSIVGSPMGTGTHCNITYKNIGGSAKENMNTSAIGTFEFKEVKDCLKQQAEK